MNAAGLAAIGVLGGVIVVGLICGYAVLGVWLEQRRERRRLGELCRVSHVDMECPGPWLGRACEVCRRHLDGAA